MMWQLSYRADPTVVPLADRHYNRQSVGSKQFVPPGGCVVLATPERDAFWVTSTPKAEFVKHAWAGAWMCSAFRNESARVSSDMIRAATAATLFVKGNPPALGFVTFVDPAHVKPTIRRGRATYGYCYLMAGWRHVGFTKAGLWAWQLAPEDFPPAIAPLTARLELALGA